MYKENFHTRLKQARKRADMTQDEVAKELDIDRTTLSRYENGILEPNIEILGMLIDLYNINANWLIGTGINQNML